MKLSELGDARILIVGYGREGRSTLAFLKHHFPHKQVDITDEGDGPDYLIKQPQYDLVIKSPGVPKRLITVPYTTATNIFFANTRGITIGVTGTKGKSTTATLLYHIFKEARRRVSLVGNIGNPMLSALLEEKGPDDMYICELSSYQLSDIGYCPHVAVITNEYPEHMDYHGSAKLYWQAKERIVAFAGAGDYYVYNPVFPRLVALAKRTRAKAIPFLTNLPFSTTNLALVGQHNIDNIRAAVTVAGLFHISTKVIAAAVKRVAPLPHRLEPVGTYRGITFYDDAIATIPESTIAALKALPKVDTILLGGLNRGYDFVALSKEIVSLGVKNIVAFPESGPQIITYIKQEVGEAPVNILETDDMGEAVKFAYAHTRPGFICLLSTASPSYSIWKNFEEKGNLFQHFVKKYGTMG